jgi:hypothetical protein
MDDGSEADVSIPSQSQDTQMNQSVHMNLAREDEARTVPKKKKQQYDVWMSLGPRDLPREKRERETKRRNARTSEAQDAAVRSTQKQIFGAYLAITIQYLIKRSVRK